MTTPPVELKRTYCKVCMSNCGLVAEVADDRKILKVKGDFDHPITKGLPDFWTDCSNSGFIRFTAIMTDACWQS